MEFADSIQLTKVLLLALLLLVCSVTDLRMRRIPNAVLLPVLMTALSLASLTSGLPGLLDSLAGLAVGLLMLMPLHVLGRMGAGDVKLLGVVGSILGGWGAVVAGLATMMAGAILGFAYILWSALKPAVTSRARGFVHRLEGNGNRTDEVATWQTIRATEVPYAIAIAAGTFAALYYLDLITKAGIA